MNQIEDPYRDLPTLKKKQSWFGNIIRTVAVQSALTSKAAVDSVRERISGSSMPRLPENNAEDRDQQAILSNPDHQAPRHRRTISARTTLSSIRAHLPRCSLNNKRHSVANLLARAESHSSRRRSQEASYATPSRKDFTILAAAIPLPSSPIDMLGRAPTLSLDLGSSHLISPPVHEKNGYDRQDLAIEKDLSGLSHLNLPLPLAKVLLPVESKIPGPWQPIAEARRASKSAGAACLSPDQNGHIIVDLESPLPGTNAHLELDDTCSHPMMVKEPESSPVTQFSRSRIPLIDTTTALSAKTETDHAPIDPHVSHVPMESTKDYQCRSTAPCQDRSASDAEQPIHPASTGEQVTKRVSSSDMTANEHGIEHSGLPSPDKRIRLPFRTRFPIEDCTTPRVSRVDSFQDMAQNATAVEPETSSPASAILKSGRQRFTPVRHQSVKCHTPDAAAAIMRERTSDHLQYLDQMNWTSDAKSRNASPADRRPDHGLFDTPSSAGCARTPSTTQSKLSPAVFNVATNENRLEATPSGRSGWMSQSSSPYQSSSPSRFSPVAYRSFDQDFMAADSSTPDDTPRHRSIHNRFSLLADSDDMISDEEDDDI